MQNFLLTNETFSKSEELTIQNKSDVALLIKSQHELIVEKILPEIDLHFEILFKEAPKSYSTELQYAHAEFKRIDNLLSDHIFMEDNFVLPKVLGGVKELNHTVQEFVDNHENFELLIQNMIKEFQIYLNPLQEYLPFRILLLKMERLQLLLEEHGVLEDQLFGDYL